MSTNEGVSLTIERGVSLAVQRSFVTVTVYPSGVPGPPGGTGDGDGGLTQDDADARYVQRSQVDATNGVAALDAGRRINEDRLPEPPIDLVVLFENQLV
jgi:hypothetical protein